MAFDLYSGDFDDQTALVTYLMQLFGFARMNRLNFEVQWEESAAMCYPEYRNSFTFGHVRSPGAKYTQFQVDSTGSIASHRFMSVCDALITPFNSLWSPLRAQDLYLRKQRGVAQFYDDLTRRLWAERYKWVANFQGQNQQNFQVLGVFGNHGMWIDEYDAAPLRRTPGFRYMSNSPGEIYILQNHQGREHGCIRHFRWTATQAYSKWPEIATDERHGRLKAALDKGDAFTMFDFLQFVIPRTDYDPHKVFSHAGKPWASIYVSVPGHNILEMGGYRSYPRAGGRYSQAPEEWYGRGPAQMVLPELKTLNSLKEVYLKVGAMAGDPTYLLPEDGLFDFKATSGSYAYGAVSEDGRPLVHLMPAGQIQVTDELMQSVSKSVQDAFLLSLFPLLFDQKGPQRSAREVVEMAIQQGIFLSPLSRQYTEYCGPIVERELDLMSWLGMLPDIPPVMREAMGDEGIQYEVKFDSPLAQALDMPAIAGFMRTVEMANTISQARGGDQSVFYPFAFKRAIPAIAENQRVPVDWMSTDKEVADQEKAAAQAAQADQQLKSLPGQAAIMKAKAISDKAAAGQNIGGTLSGTPQGGMPELPEGQY